MPDRSLIYDNDPQTYDLLIAREDYEGNLLRTMQSIYNFSDKKIADLGAGTGRLSILLAPFIRSSLMTDDAKAMLKLAEQKLRSIHFYNFTTTVCDIGKVPAADRSLDVVLAGWALIGKALRGNPWQNEVKDVLQEMQRVTQSGGICIIIESLGTGQENPQPPNDRFAEYFKLLEEEGFQKTCIRTDYKFVSLEEKERLLTFFFDQEMLDIGAKDNSLVYPECTGIWWKICE